MTIFLVSSLEDPAGTNIKTGVLKYSAWKDIDIFQNNPVYQHTTYPNIYLITITDSTIHHENLDQEIYSSLHQKPTLLIFLSRHRSEMKKPTLTVHPIGNYGKAEFGGKARTLVPSAPLPMTQLLRLMKQQLKKTLLPHQVCYEVTHHGPYLETPTVFVEIGSTETEWINPKPAQVVAQSLISLFSFLQTQDDDQKKIPILVGMGGGHYAPRFTDIIFEKTTAFGHMIPSYHIEQGNFSKEMLQNAIQMTPNATGVYLHKKSLKKSQASEYSVWCNELGIPVVSSKELPDLTE